MIRVKEGITEENEEELNFPLLMVTLEGKIVLMTEEGKGVVVRSSDPGQEIGRSSEVWAMSMFKPYMGTLILSNEV